MAIGSVFIIGGTAIQATSREIGQFMAGRFLVGFGVSIISTAAPAYVVEMAHPAWRGAFTGGYNICTPLHVTADCGRLVPWFHCCGMDCVWNEWKYHFDICMETSDRITSRSVCNRTTFRLLSTRNTEVASLCWSSW